MNQGKLKNDILFSNLLRLISVGFERDTKPFEVLRTAVNYKVTEVDRDHAYSVYKIRRRLRERTPVHLREFDMVLENLSKYGGEKILIHMFKIEGGILLFFTSIDCSEMLGYISSSESGEGFAENR